MCGIFGIINKKPSKFDSVTFNLLGFHNDTRGGDSCGIFIDGKVEYGNDKLKLYQNFYQQSELLKETKKCEIALGHCRKASVGGVSPEKAQPVVIYDENDDTKINFVLIHNGTITNHSDLAKEYIPDIDTKNMTDSQIIANIIYNCGTDVFGEYVGAGVFVFVDYRNEKPEIYVFKGESKEYYSSTTSTEERPLCFVSTENKFIFSSLPNFLRPLQPDLTVYDMPTNKLMTIRDCKLYTVKEYDRSQKNRSGYVPSKSTSQYPIQRSFPYEDDYYDEYGEYWPNGYEYGYGWREKSKNESKERKERKEEKEIINQANKANNNTIALVDKISCDKDYIFRHQNRVPCHGRITVDECGYVRPSGSEGSLTLWFFNGVLLYGKNSYRHLMTDKISQKKPLFDFSEDNYIVINAESPYPFTIADEFATTKEYYKSEDGETFQPFSGYVPIVFTASLEYFNNGESTGSIYLSEKEAFNKLKALLNENESSK